MKIQLKRNPRSQPHRLRCIACWQSFYGSRSRSILYRQDGTVAGDVCKSCLKQGASHIQQQLKNRATGLFKQPLNEAMSPSPHKQALELWELATELLVIPPFYDRWWQRLLIFVADTQDLDRAKSGRANLRAHQPKPHQITFEPEEPSSFFHGGDANSKDK
jgi:hypothetical protein